MPKLQCLTILFCAFVCANLEGIEYSEETKKLMANLHATCTKETELDSGIIEKFNGGEVVDDTKLKCYMKCVMKETGVMSDAGDLDFGPLEELLPKDMVEVAKHTFEECAGKAEATDLCEKAYSVMKCGHDSDPKKFQIP